MNSSSFQSVRILLVEDNPADIRLTKEIFQECHIQNHLQVVTDGEEATAYLNRQGAYADAPSPDLILLDLNLPKKSGRQLLMEIKGDPALQRIPIVILTTSQADRDVIDAYNFRANCYILKPIELDRFIQVVQNIESFWLTTVKLPPS